MSVFEKCDGYLDGRSGTYEFRCRRYDAVATILERNGLDTSHTVADVGAGWTEFGHRLTERHFRGRYIPYDGAIDGVDLTYWEPPPTRIDWIVAIEFLEHLHEPEVLVRTMFSKAERGVIITTPNSDVVDTIAMDGDHVTALRGRDLLGMGFTEMYRMNLFTDRRGDTLVAAKFFH